MKMVKRETRLPGMPDRVYCIPCKRSYPWNHHCDHFWWCSFDEMFLGGGDADAGCFACEECLAKARGD